MSRNGGRTWRGASQGMTARFVRAFAIDPSDHRTIYAGAIEAGLFRSLDGGIHWHALPQA
jgi:hypothetical protein